MQDRKAGREINDEEYIPHEWCLNRCKSRCEKSNTLFNVEVKQSKLCSNFTARRLCDDYGHNCCASCFYCNVSVHEIAMGSFVIYMASDKQKIINDIYYDRSGFGSRVTTLKDAREKDKRSTKEDVEECFFLKEECRREEETQR